jgi:hypothetical protein
MGQQRGVNRMPRRKAKDVPRDESGLANWRDFTKIYVAPIQRSFFTSNSLIFIGNEKLVTYQFLKRYPHSGRRFKPI